MLPQAITSANTENADFHLEILVGINMFFNIRNHRPGEIIDGIFRGSWLSGKVEIQMRTVPMPAKC